MPWSGKKKLNLYSAISRVSLNTKSKNNQLWSEVESPATLGAKLSENISKITSCVKKAVCMNVQLLFSAHPH